MQILVTKKDSVPDLHADFIELAMILDRLRRFTIKWENEYGAINKNNKKHWEARADEWLHKYLVYETPGEENTPKKHDHYV